MSDAYYECCGCGREDVINAVKSLAGDYWMCHECYYDVDNLIDEIDKAWTDKAKYEEAHHNLAKENERLKERIDYLEGYIKMLKDNEVSDVIGEVRDGM